jgi:hypothetical protein
LRVHRSTHRANATGAHQPEPAGTDRRGHSPRASRPPGLARSGPPQSWDSPSQAGPHQSGTPR